MLPMFLSILKWALAPISAGLVLKLVLRPRLVAAFDPNDSQCNEAVGIVGTSHVAVALRVRVSHVFGAKAKGCVGKLVELRHYGQEPEERGGQPLPWRDRDTREGITLARGDVEYVNVANVQVDTTTGNSGLVICTPRGGKRIRSLPSGVYHFAVAVNVENGMSPRASFGIMFDASAVPDKTPFLFALDGSVEHTPSWRIWLGF